MSNESTETQANSLIESFSDRLNGLSNYTKALCQLYASKGDVDVLSTVLRNLEAVEHGEADKVNSAGFQAMLLYTAVIKRISKTSGYDLYVTIGNHVIAELEPLLGEQEGEVVH